VSQTESVNFGKYRILERISSGGMAEIFKARLDGIGGFHRTFAIKRILPHLSSNPEFVDLLVDEAKVAGLLSHANIVQILDLGRIDDRYFIAMEYVAGRNLGEVERRCLEKGITLPVPHAVFICIEILKGLEYAHNRQVMRDGHPVPLNIVHRDISPPNILISNQGEVKITDFGMAKASVKALETVAGVVKGRFDYLSPEQSEAHPVSQQSDIYSLGILLYEMLVGDHPFRKDTDLATLEAIKAGDFEPASFVNMDIPPQLDDVIAKALEAEPAKRFASPTAFKEELDRFFHESEFIFTQSTLAAFLKGLFPEKKAGAARQRPEQRPHAMPTAIGAPGPIDDFDEDVLPTVVRESPLSHVSPFSPHEAKPEPAPKKSSDEALFEAATMLRQIPDPNAAADFGQSAGLSEAATLIRANPLLSDNLGEAETLIKRTPPVMKKAIEAAERAQRPLDQADPALAERPTQARDEPPGRPMPQPAEAPRPAPQTIPAVRTAPLAAVGPRPTPMAPPAGQPAAPAGAPAQAQEEVLPAARVPLGMQLVYMGLALFTLILGLLFGTLTGYMLGSFLAKPDPVQPVPATVELALPEGSALLLDGERQVPQKDASGVKPYVLQLQSGSSRSIAVELDEPAAKEK